MAGRSEKAGNPGGENPEPRQISPLGQAIRFFRDERLMSQETLAGLAEIDKQRISDIERGETRTLHAPTLNAIAAGFGISIDELRAKEREFRDAPNLAKTEAVTPPSKTLSPGLVHNDIRPVAGFTGRQDLLSEIDDALWKRGGTAAITQAAAVKGLGGVGKSVLAREYAWQARGRYHGVWWVRAETEHTLIDDLIELGSRLIPNLKEMQERERALHLALDAIAAAGGDKPWLIVYDNVEKPGAIRKLKPREHAHILITSRWPDWQDEAQELPVDVFTSDVAIDYLLAKRSRETREAAGHLADKLGYLPLALSHARAYCALTNLSFDDYTRRLSELIQEVPADAEYPRSVHATFNIALAKAVEACPEAEKLMAIAAFLAPERIPLDIFTSDVVSEKQRDRAVAALYQLSLLSHATTETGAPAFTLHRLVQQVMRSYLRHD